MATGGCVSFSPRAQPDVARVVGHSADTARAHEVLTEGQEAGSASILHVEGRDRGWCLVDGKRVAYP